VHQGLVRAIGMCADRGACTAQVPRYLDGIAAVPANWRLYIMPEVNLCGLAASCGAASLRLAGRCLRQRAMGVLMWPVPACWRRSSACPRRCSSGPACCSSLEPRTRAAARRRRRRDRSRQSRLGRRQRCAFAVAGPDRARLRLRHRAGARRARAGADAVDRHRARAVRRSRPSPAAAARRRRVCSRFRRR